MVVRGCQQAVSTLTELSGLQVRTEVRQVLNMGWRLWFPHPSPSPGHTSCLETLTSVQIFQAPDSRLSLAKPMMSAELFSIK